MTIGILLMLNNYVHDVATGLLLISALWLAWSARELGNTPSPELIDYFRRTYRRCVRFVVGSIAVIVATGIIRTLNFMSFEYRPALGSGLVQVLIMKHVLIFAMLGAGIYAWLGVRRRLESMR
ncbi:MAG: hypothetical protein ACYC7A_08935 [Thermoanaerobaculia bacterium]